MHENKNEPELGSSSTDQENSFNVKLEPINSAFGISADTLRALASSHSITPEALLVRAATMYAQADIPNFDLDAPVLSTEQTQYLEQRRLTRDAQSTSQQLTLAETFKRLIEGSGENHANDAESVPRNGRHS